MAVGAVLNSVTDVGEWFARLLGRRGDSEGAIPYRNPRQLVDALHNSSTEAAAVARMHSMHYGAFYNKTSRSMFSGIAERELLKKGTGFSGALFGRPAKGLSVGLSHTKYFGYFAAGAGMLDAATSARGHKLSGFVGGVGKSLTFLAADVVGTFLGGPILGQAFGWTAEHFAGKAQEGLQTFIDFNKNMRHINMGGNYEDTRVAYTMRQRAAQEMGSSVMNARQYLGKEAALMHQ